MKRLNRFRFTTLCVEHFLCQLAQTDKIAGIDVVGVRLSEVRVLCKRIWCENLADLGDLLIWCIDRNKSIIPHVRMMKTLNQNWFVDGLIDFEHKKYTLLAYLHAVQANFGQKKLFPDLTELRGHYERTVDFQRQKYQFYNQLAKTVRGIDWDQLSLQYEYPANNEPLLDEVEDIVRYSIPKFKKALGLGQEIMAEVEESITVSPVGIVPLHLKEGYLFVYEQISKQTDVYQYAITLFDSEVPPARRMHTTYITTVKKSLGTTFESLKLQLVKQYQAFPNPASYMVECKLPFPMEETLLPIAKRKAVRYILNEAQ